jgi:hypothetical protein
LKLTATTGSEVVLLVKYPGAVAPFINTLFVIGGKSLAKVIVPDTEKVIPEYWVEGAAFTESIAALREPGPESLNVVTA